MGTFKESYEHHQKKVPVVQKRPLIRFLFLHQPAELLIKMISLNESFGTDSLLQSVEGIKINRFPVWARVWNCKPETVWFPTVAAAPLPYMQSVESSETSLGSGAGASGSYPECLPAWEGVILAGRWKGLWARARLFSFFFSKWRRKQDTSLNIVYVTVEKNIFCSTHTIRRLQRR